jgi:hypothetical protein
MEIITRNAYTCFIRNREVTDFKHFLTPFIYLFVSYNCAKFLHDQKQKLIGFTMSHEILVYVQILHRRHGIN